MYHPYLRGKQNELLVIRENARLLSDANFTPIVEPVKGSLIGLQKTLSEIVACDGSAAIVVNPQHGELNQNGDTLTDLLTDNFTEHDQIIAAVLATSTSSITDIVDNCNRHSNHPLALIHIDFPDAKNLASALGSIVDSMKHIFFDSGTTKAKLYQKYFMGAPPVLIRDGFEKRSRGVLHTRSPYI